VGPDSEEEEALREALRLGDDDYQEGRRRQVPAEATGGAEVYAFDLMVLSDWLPTDTLELPMIPCVATPGADGHIMMIPDDVLSEVVNSGADAVPGSAKEREAETAMAEWLAHPSEFGVRPDSVRFERTYHGRLPGAGEIEVDLVEYVMPDGTTGRGFVNGPLTWSFVGDEVTPIGDDDLFLAYCGWAWLFPALRSGDVETEFISDGEEQRFLEQKDQQGLRDIEITSRYRIGGTELFEFTGTYEERSVKGAGNTDDEVEFVDGDPLSNLPPVYFLLGRLAMESAS
jgi:hypothetical protein